MGVLKGEGGEGLFLCFVRGVAGEGVGKGGRGGRGLFFFFFSFRDGLVYNDSVWGRAGGAGGASYNTPVSYQFFFFVFFFVPRQRWEGGGEKKN